MTGAVEKVYSDALFEIAKDEKSSEIVKDELIAAVKALDACPDIYKVLSAPNISNGEKTDIIEKIFGGKISDTTLNFLCVLTLKGRIKYLSGITEDFHDKWRDKEDVLGVTVTSAKSLTDKQRKQLVKKLSEKYHKKIELSEKTDPDIMGGLIVSFKDTMLDGSVRTRLRDIREAMKQGK